jgi:hypothetical protein
VERIVDLTASRCTTITNGYFRNLNSQEGGAICIKKHLELTLTDSTFVTCSSTGSSTGFGGACGLGSDKITMSRCCGTSCWSNVDGMFLYLIGKNKGENVNLDASNRQISFTSALSCGTTSDSNSHGTMYLGEALAAELSYINITNCYVLKDGAAFFAQQFDGTFTCQYMNIARCGSALQSFGPAGTRNPAPR